MSFRRVPVSYFLRNCCPLCWSCTRDLCPCPCFLGGWVARGDCKLPKVKKNSSSLPSVLHSSVFYKETHHPWCRIYMGQFSTLSSVFRYSNLVEIKAWHTNLVPEAHCIQVVQLHNISLLCVVQKCRIRLCKNIRSESREENMEAHVWSAGWLVL